MELYVAADKRQPQRHDVGSILCLRALDLLPASHAPAVRDATAVRPRPQWLVGTPTLRLPDGDTLRGHEAVEHLQRLAVELARAEAAAPKTTRPPPRPLAPAPVGLVAARAAPPAATPPLVDDDVDDEVDALFASRIADDGDDDGDVGARKITGDDLARALRAREASAPSGPPAGAPPPPPPQFSATA